MSPPESSEMFIFGLLANVYIPIYQGPEINSRIIVKQLLTGIYACYSFLICV